MTDSLMNRESRLPPQPSESASGSTPGVNAPVHPAPDRAQRHQRAEELRAWAYVSLYPDPAGARRAARAALDLARVQRQPAAEAWAALSLALAYLVGSDLNAGSIR